MDAVPKGDYYHIRSVATGKHNRPRNANNFTEVFTVPGTWVGKWTQWSIEELPGGSYRFRNRYTEKFMSPDHGEDHAAVRQRPNTYVGNWTAWQLEAVDSAKTFQHNMTYEDETLTINFSEYSVRGPMFAVLAQQADGSLVEEEVSDEVRTYIGRVEEHADAYAIGLVRDSGEIYATVIFPMYRTWIQQGDSVFEIRPDAYEPLMPSAFLTEKAGSNVYAVDMLLDLTYHYYNSVGNSV